MKVIICGAGQVGYGIAERLSQEGNDVSVIDTSASLVSRMEDTGTVLQPVTWLVMLPYFLIIFFFYTDLLIISFLFQLFNHILLISLLNY